MIKSTLALAAALALSVAGAFAASNPAPHLERRGAATQLVVDGQPFLILGGELANTASSSPEYMAPVWPRLARMNLNTVLVGVSWALTEPTEGQYDFSLVDQALASARQNHLHVILIWFGSWKNGISSFVPDWVKEDQDRFPRVRIRSGKAIEVLSTLSAANRDADLRAYAAFMRHLRAVDGDKHTTLMIQLENEVGILGDSRDRSPAAEAAFAGPVPEALMAYLARHGDHLRPALSQVWEAAGGKPAGTWQEVFGAETPDKKTGLVTDEIFMAWNYARYMDQLAAAGKAIYPIPVFTNTWIIQPEDKGAGDYPSGGPEPHVLDLWRAGAPHIDINAPDIYLPNFTEWVARFNQNGNTLFVPESRGDAGGVANAFYAIGRHQGIGYSPFGIDNTGRLLVQHPDAGQTGPADVTSQPLPRGYALLRDMTPAILDAQARGAISAVSLTATGRQNETVALGDFNLNVDLRRNPRDPSQVPAFGYALLIGLSPSEFVVAGYDVQVTFAPNTPGAPIAGLARVESGRYADGRWVATRVLNGDDILLNYHLDEAAAVNQSGSGLKFMGDEPTVQRVKLYRYR
jgi:beta-galactosidase GanA